MVRFFSGHLIPGALLLSLSLRWTISVSYWYSKSKSKKTNFRSTATMELPPGFWLLRHRLVETFVKLAGSLYGVVIHWFEANEARIHAERGILEYDGEFGDTWSIMYRTNHHYIIYMGFLLSSLVEALVYVGVHFPRKSQHAMLIITFATEGFMFYFHLTSRTSVDVQFHVMQTLSIFGCVLFSALECVNDRQVLFSLGRCLFVALQGSWFVQIAFALYYPLEWPPLKWNLHELKLIPNVTFYFCLHFLGVLVAIMLVFLFIQSVVEKKKRSEKNSEVEEEKINLPTYKGLIFEYLKSFKPKDSLSSRHIWRYPKLLENDLVYVF